MLPLDNEVVVSWLIFWLSYLSTGALFTYYAHVTGKRKVNGLVSTVAYQTIHNMLITWLGATLVKTIPSYELDIHWSWKILLSTIIAEVWFYHSHIVFHVHPFYKWFHKVHHTYKKPYALAGLYTSSVEIILSSVPSVGIGPVLFGLHGVPLYLWVAIAGYNTTSSHSGLDFWPFIDKSHDMHHKYFNVNYGSLGILDWLYGTSFYEDPHPA